MWWVNETKPLWLRDHNKQNQRNKYVSDDSFGIQVSCGREQESFHSPFLLLQLWMETWLFCCCAESAQESHWVPLSPAESRCVPLSPTVSYWVPLCPIESYWVPLSLAESCWVLLAQFTSGLELFILLLRFNNTHTRFTQQRTASQWLGSHNPFVQDQLFNKASLFAGLWLILVCFI